MKRIRINKDEVNRILNSINKTNLLLTILALISIILAFNITGNKTNTNNNNITEEKTNNMTNNNSKENKKSILSIFNNNYIYQKELKQLNYTEEEINTIEEKINEEDVKKYLLEKKYNNLTTFINSNYFNISNIYRYQNYYDKNNYDIKNIVLYVEMGLDKEFYTNTKKSNVNNGKLILVNKYNYVDENYDASLIDVDKSYGNGKMNKEAYTYFKKMVDAAKKDNISLRGISTYRSYSVQKEIYEGYVSRDSQKNADTYSARPGHSEHQTGLAVDINTANSSEHFENSKEYEWLINNSYKYGFILRYPENKTFITGYKYEPWHYRYIGLTDAKKLYEENITYEEYYFKYVENSY